MMPLLFIFFIVLVIRSLTLDGAIEGIKFMFVPDWSYFTGKTLLMALGQAFFSLSVGVSAMLTYASYLSKETKIGSSAMNVAWMNIGISLLAGLVIFPAVFALGYSPDQGGASLYYYTCCVPANSFWFSVYDHFLYLIIICNSDICYCYVRNCCSNCDGIQNMINVSNIHGYAALGFSSLVFLVHYLLVHCQILKFSVYRFLIQLISLRIILVCQ